RQLAETTGRAHERRSRRGYRSAGTHFARPHDVTASTRRKNAEHAVTIPRDVQPYLITRKCGAPRFDDLSSSPDGLSSASLPSPGGGVSGAGGPPGSPSANIMPWPFSCA